MKYIKLLDKFCYSLIEDLISWRNKLVVVTIIFIFVALSTKNSVIISITSSFWTLLIGYYFHLRQKQQNNGIINKSEFDKESNYEGK